ncbi:hypothetical protein V8J36_09890 [Frigidibacter sp. MR17.14]|uniref:hypothetical protein n=1 Tax=Frigidibacter sp. MR17.14 TaxID=3126509 RepID=UPI003012CFA2
MTRFRKGALSACALATGLIGGAASAQQYTYGYTAQNGYGAGGGGGYGAGGSGAGSYGGSQGGSSFGNGYTIEGRVEYEWLATRDHNRGLAYGDVTFGFMSSSSPFGWELGFQGYQSDEGDIAVYGAGKMALGNGVISAGVPRSSMDTFLDIPALGGSQSVDLATGVMTRGFVGTTYLHSGDTPWGLRYDGTFQQATVSGSVHQFEGDGTVIDGTVSVKAGQFTLSAGAENVDRRDNSGVNTVSGVKYDAGGWQGGLYYSDVQRPGDMSGWTGYGSWTPGGPLTITGSVIATRQDGRGSTLYGASAEYTVWENAYVQGGVLDGDDTDATWDLSMGWKF